MITGELATLLQSGVSILVGTRDARLVPHCARAIGARVEDGGRELTVFLPAATGGAVVADARENGRIAVSFSRPFDHRSVQVKGRAAAVAEAQDEDRTVVDRYRRAYASALGEVGVAPRTVFRITHWPGVAIRIRVEALYIQTPGPGAGAPLEPETAR